MKIYTKLLWLAITLTIMINTNNSAHNKNIIIDNIIAHRFVVYIHLNTSLIQFIPHYNSHNSNHNHNNNNYNYSKLSFYCAHLSLVRFIFSLFLSLNTHRENIYTNKNILNAFCCNKRCILCKKKIVFK